MAQFRPANHAKGDANTIGGYAAVHDRPAAFEGRDGFSYSVELMVEPTQDADEWGEFLLFIRWSRIGTQTPEGHLETDYLIRARTAEETRDRLGGLTLQDGRRLLDDLIRAQHGDQSGRRWWDGISESERHRE